MKHGGKMRYAAVFALAILTPSSAALSQDAQPAIAIVGAVQTPETLTLQDLQKLPLTTVSVSFETVNGSESASYAGALFWTAVSAAAPIDSVGKNARLRHIFLVSGRDGYAAALSEGELDPKLEGKSVILAYEKDGKPLADGIRLIVPGDHHAARAVRDVVRIDVQ
jgi:DMSO/TMAO reductase YedYZ molybdopterin-dependent catalytic subunit